MAISVLGDGCRYCQPQEYIDRLEEWIEGDKKEIEHLEVALQVLKDKINECWMLAYPESIADTGKEKLRVFNLYQDLKDTRFNYRVLHKAYLEMDKKLNDYNRNNQN